MVTSPGTGSPPQMHPPPPVPQDPTISNTLTNFLQQFSLWCRQGFAAKMNARQPLQGILLQAFDAPAGVTPNVFMLQIRQNAQFVTTPMPPGGANPSP